jgi:hypothetical protein
MASFSPGTWDISVIDDLFCCAVTEDCVSIVTFCNSVRQPSRSLKIDVDSQILCDRRRKSDDELEVRSVPTDRSRTFSSSSKAEQLKN